MLHTITVETSMITACAYAKALRRRRGREHRQSRRAQLGRGRHKRGDMRVAVDALKKSQRGVCVVRDGKILALVGLPIAGLLSDQRATVVAQQSEELKSVGVEASCVLPYMGFNLLPLSVIPEIRLADKGLALVPEMKLVPLFE